MGRHRGCLPTNRDLRRRTIHDSRHSPEDGLRGLWRELTNPIHAPHLRLFFELYGQAIQGRGYAAALLDDFADAWEAPVTQILHREDQLGSRPSPDAHLTAAVIHGLLVNLLATGDTISANDAFERSWPPSWPGRPRRRADSER